MRADKAQKIQEEVDGLTVEQLRRNLITCDFRGPEFKELCLNKLLEIARSEGFLYRVTPE